MSEFDVIINAPVAATILTITLITSIRAFRDPILREGFIFNPVLILRHKQYQRLLTSGLIHNGAMHLAFNMLAFYFFAFSMERNLGHWQFAVMYILSLVISDIPSLIRHKDNEHYRSLGASGAVSAVLFSAILFDPEMGIGLLFIPGYIPGWLFGVLFLVISYIASFRMGGRINHDAHIWGALSGAVITILLKPQVATTFKQWILSSF